MVIINPADYQNKVYNSCHFYLQKNGAVNLSAALVKLFNIENEPREYLVVTKEEGKFYVMPYTNLGFRLSQAKNVYRVLDSFGAFLIVELKLKKDRPYRIYVDENKNKKYGAYEILEAEEIG